MKRCRTFLWIGIFLFYASTTAQGVLPADSGEFQLAAARWGILHPPGYPLYTIAGGIWTHLLPLGNPMWRLNLFSAALAATTLVLVCETVYRWSGQWSGGLLASFLLATAPTFWAQATTANIRMPTMLFAAWGFHALPIPPADEEAETVIDAALPKLALILGLGIGHHPSLAFIAASWALYLFLLTPTWLKRWRTLWQAGLIAALSWALPQLYLPLRGGMEGVPLAVPELNTWHGFWHHVLAQGFAGDMFAFVNRADLAMRLPLIPTLFHVQFPWLALGAAGLSWIALLRRRWRLALALMAALLLHTFVAITYRAPQTVEYLMPAYLPIVLTLGVGATAAFEWATASPKRHRLAQLLLLLLTIGLIGRTVGEWRDFHLQADDAPLRARLDPLLLDVPPQATILADWRWATPLWTLQQVEGIRPDVEVLYVYPVQGRDYEAIWKARAAEVKGPLFTTHRFDWEKWTFIPWGGGYRLERRPLSTWHLPPGYQEITGTMELLEPLAWRTTGPLHPGATLEVDLAWRRLTDSTAPPSWTIQLFAADGTFFTHGDRFIGDEGEVGEVRVATMALPLPTDYCGEATLRAALYLTTDDGFQTVGDHPLGRIRLPCEPFTLPPARWRPNLFLDGGPFIRGVDYEEDGRRLYLHLCGPGRTLIAASGGEERVIEAAEPWRCRTVVLPWDGSPPRLSRADGRSAHLLLPWPQPQPAEHYLPFEDRMVLTDVRIVERANSPVAEVRWLVARPQVDDLAVSLRLHAADGNLLAVHDMQPALAALPTLKWVVRGLRILDPHPLEFEGPFPADGFITVAVYERFRLTPSLSPIEGLPLHWR